jgi:hypothetical protein
VVAFLIALLKCNGSGGRFAASSLCKLVVASLEEMDWVTGSHLWEECLVAEKAFQIVAALTHVSGLRHDHCADDNNHEHKRESVRDLPVALRR